MPRPENPGQQGRDRAAEAHARNAERKAGKDAEKAARRAAKDAEKAARPRDDDDDEVVEVDNPLPVEPMEPAETPLQRQDVPPSQDTPS